MISKRRIGEQIGEGETEQHIKRNGYHQQKLINTSHTCKSTFFLYVKKAVSHSIIIIAMTF